MTLIQKPPKSGTKQEKKISDILKEFGLRFQEQVTIGNYWVDFLIQDVPYVVEADGFYGHFKKADSIRDEKLKEFGIKKIIHIKTNKIDEIRKILLREVFDIDKE